MHELPGVSFVDNPVGREINGSLWTLRLEFVMYLMVLALGLARLLTVRVTFLLLAFGIACVYFEFLLRDTRIFDGRVAVLALAGLVLSVPQRLFIPLFPVFGCYLALWLALNPRLPVIPAARFGDLSYGIYIYGWPVEQVVIWLFGGRAAWWQVFVIALPTTSALSARSMALAMAAQVGTVAGSPMPLTSVFVRPR